MKSDRPYLEHILDSVTAIETYVAGGRESFLHERLIQDAVIRNFEIIGEAAGTAVARTEGEVDAPWSQMIAFRNRLIHGYWSVDLILVWDVILHQLPALRSAVKSLIDGQTPSPPPDSGLG